MSGTFFAVLTLLSVLPLTVGLRVTCVSRCISSSSSVLLLSLWKSSLSCSCSLSSQSARLAEAAAWRRRARRRQTGGSGGAAGGCGRQPAPAAVKTTQFCVSLKLSLLLRSASLFCCNSPQLWLCWAGRGGSADATLLRSAWSSGHKMDGGAPSLPARDQQLCCRGVRCLFPHLETRAGDTSRSCSTLSHSADCSCVGEEETEPRHTRFLPSWWVLVGFSIQY